jgi:hypothetical protein
MRPIHLPIADPCHEDWDAMEPRERGRFCAHCRKDVHDLSSMTEDDARELLRARAGTRLCVNYRHDGHGRILFRTALAAATALAACTPHERAQPSPMADAIEATPIEGAAPTIPAEPPRPVESEREPAPRMLGQIAAPPPEPVPMRKGDVAIPNEPCDPPARQMKGKVVPVRPRPAAEAPE